MKLDALCRNIQILLSDVNGVLTDGGIILDNQGIESKRFHVRDGLGIRLWKRAGGRFGLITARTSQVVRMRAIELDVEIVRQGIEDKRAAVEEILQELNLQPQQLCYIGDDLADLPVIQWAGLGVAVADAASEVRQGARYVTKSPGGQGAVRELVEMLLKSQQRWDELIGRYKA